MFGIFENVIYESSMQYYKHFHRVIFNQTSVQMYTNVNMRCTYSDKCSKQNVYTKSKKLPVLFINLKCIGTFQVIFFLVSTVERGTNLISRYV